MKEGANLADQAQIRKLKAAGLKVDEISKSLGINIDTVKSFMTFDPRKFSAEEKAREKEARELLAEQEAVARAAAEGAAAAVAADKK